MKKQNSIQETKIFDSMKYFVLCAVSIYLLLTITMTAHAEESYAVTVRSSNNTMGAVNSFKNDVSFQNYTYAASTDYIKVSALNVNTIYTFLYWTDNGAIVSQNSTYAFAVNGKNHNIVAHFNNKNEKKDKKYDTDNNLSWITRNTDPCVFAKGYKLDGMTINTTLTTIDDATLAAVQSLTGGSFAGAFQIRFTYGYAGTPKQQLDQTTRLCLQIPAQFQSAGRTFCIVSLAGNTPTVLSDLDRDDATITFDTNASGLYVAAYHNDASALPQLQQPVVPVTSEVSQSAVTVPVTPEIQQPTVTTPAMPPAVQPAATPAVSPVTESEYQDAVIKVLRYQLQQAGITPAA